MYALTTAGQILKYNTAANSYSTIVPSISLGIGSYPLIAFDSCSGLLYVGANYNSGSFFSVNPATSATVSLPTNPDLVLGQSLCGDRSGHIYTVGSSSTTHVFQYTISTGAWTALPASLFTDGVDTTCTVGGDGYLYLSQGATTGGPVEKIQPQ